MKYMFVLISALAAIYSCSPSYKFNKNKEAFNSSKVKMSFVSIADMNDSHFEIRENNFFEFYRELFDSVKNTRYPGTFIEKGDTLHLSFYNKKGKALLGSKAVVNKEHEKIVFFK